MPINNTNKTRIQSYGCSYTAGAELFDHLIDPKADLIKLKRGVMYWLNHHVHAQTTEFVQRIWQLELASAWPAIVAQHYQVDFLNKAKGGTALAMSLLAFEQDLIANPQLVNDTLFVFGITNSSRIVKFNSVEAQTLMMAMPEFWRDPRLDYYTALALWDETALTWNHLQLLQRLLAVADRSGADVLIFDMMGQAGCPLWRSHKDIAPYMIPTFDHVWNQIESDSRVCFAQSLHGQQPRSCHGGGHPKISMHQSFSQYVIDCIDSRLR